VTEAGAIRGLIKSQRRIHLMSSGIANTLGTAAPVMQEAIADRLLSERMETWSCGNEAQPGLVLSDSASSRRLSQKAATTYTARIALDTDWELLQRFDGSTDTATAYIAELMAAISGIYLRDTGTALEIGHLSFWSGGANADPWTATDSSALSEFRSYWRANRSGINRSLAHLLSGKGVGLGVAYVGSLCSTSTGYGVSMGISGSFDSAMPRAVWDIVVVSHEMGHNFGSPHTHCYGDFPASGDPPVDTCYNRATAPACYQGATISLPPLGGTLMSYCHLLAGGLSNLNLLFGEPEGDNYGIDSHRVLDRMAQTVADADARYPGCLEARSTATRSTTADFDHDALSEVRVYSTGTWLEP
jgi:hypothetical protein